MKLKTSFARNLLLGLMLLPNLLLADPPKIDGSYSGSMTIDDGGGKQEIPLLTNLTLTGEFAKVEVSPGVFEMVKLIDGSFLIDSEGGPFPFAKVTYRLETSEIDMRYNRTKGVNVEQPSSYRLVGKVNDKGEISGRVLSGFKGQIGTFKLAKGDAKPLVAKLQYAGTWIGAVTMLPEGDRYRFGITVAPTGFATINPAQFEFDYTFGKIAHMQFESSKMDLRNVVIDYIHRRIVMSDAEWNSALSGLTVEAQIDFSNSKMTGYFSSAFGGKRGEFTLNRLK